jgi:hypothetical protein
LAPNTARQRFRHSGQFLPGSNCSVYVGCQHSNAVSLDPLICLEVSRLPIAHREHRCCLEQSQGRFLPCCCPSALYAITPDPSHP